MIEQIKLKDLLPKVINIAYQAGLEILMVYNGANFDIEYKDDESPLTKADKAANDIIVSGLEKNADFPILSEEGKNVDYQIRKDWQTLWLVDPLDGTKEFIKRNGEFTVNIALVNDGQPVLGVVYAPVLDEMFFAAEGYGAYKIPEFVNHSDQTETLAKLLENSIELPSIEKNDSLKVIASRSHMSEETMLFIDKLEDKYGKAEIVSAGSSLKLCRVAEGIADVYPRLAPTMEWDTAAAQAVVEAMGGSVLDLKEMDLKYNKENLLNPYFVVRRI